MKSVSVSRRELLLGAAAVPLGVACDRLSPARPRAVKTLVAAVPTVEGAGVHLRRSLGSRALPLLDPFLLLDEIHSAEAADYMPGFPTHPHRGFETVTYVLDGAFEHRDSLGNHGHLGAGSAQWMTAGHGIIHSEMPGQVEGGMWAFQLWVNLPAAQKLIAPRYQDLPAERVVELDVDGGHLRLVAGALAGRRGPVEGIVTAPQMVDVRLERRGRFALPVPADHNAFVYGLAGRVEVGPDAAPLAPGQLAVLGEGDQLLARSDEGGRFLFLSGRPIGEPVARMGPFVMNTDAELRTAVDDYRSGRLVHM